MQFISAVSMLRGTSHQELLSLAQVAPKKYKVYAIPKRNNGFRLIAQPTKELKDIQKTLVSVLAGRCLIHDAAKAYKKNLGIKDNADCHKKNTYFLKMDFQNFFNKIKPALFFEKMSSAGIELSSADRSFLEGILFWKPGKKRSVTLVLSVGAPSSPFISNFVMYDFDSVLTRWCLANGIVYSRYADDLTFSTNKEGVLFLIPKLVRGMLAKHSRGISVNESKTVFSSKAHNRHVTGIVINNDGELSLGRHKKRVISSLVHKYTLNLLSIEDISRLRGYIGQAINVEPDFIVRLKSKYGGDIIKRLNSEGVI